MSVLDAAYAEERLDMEEDLMLSIAALRRSYKLPSHTDSTIRLMSDAMNDPSILELSDDCVQALLSLKRPVMFEVKFCEDDENVTLSANGGSTSFAKATFLRLCGRFEDVNGDSDCDEMVRAIYLYGYRYSIIDPEMSRQAFMPAAVICGLGAALGRHVDFEAFASAVNTSVSSYCSLAFQVEKVFGSHGSYFDMSELPRGKARLMLVNPPRIGDVTLAAVEKTAELLRKAATDEPRILRYALVVTPPRWDDVLERLFATGLVVAMVKPPHGTVMRYIYMDGKMGPGTPRPAVTVLCSNPGRASVAPDIGDRISRALSLNMSKPKHTIRRTTTGM